ncbi:MAG: (2Fe-2S)-binding protein [Clostridiales bacterium]|jgi:NADH dehydrogenase/NADH:ubiquinone oxidoreductase subunit G|nr:(2Fe-2S)-binding protein [Clostridiales bacterium]
MLIKIDGKECGCKHGEFILEVAKRNGIEIPNLCHHEGLPGQGCCRVCIVEVEINGWRNIVTACVYPLERECEVFTNSPRVIKQRAMVLALLHSLAPGSSEVSELCEKYNVPSYRRFVKKNDTKCILCGLCAKACESLGTGAISTVNRGTGKAVTTPYGEPSYECVGCASCAKVCPTGAIMVEEGAGSRKIWGKKIPLLKCKKCGEPAGTYMELRRAAEKLGEGMPELCEACRKKEIAEKLASIYGY